MPMAEAAWATGMSSSLILHRHTSETLLRSDGFVHTFRLSGSLRSDNPLETALGGRCSATPR